MMSCGFCCLFLYLIASIISASNGATPSTTTTTEKATTAGGNGENGSGNGNGSGGENVSQTSADPDITTTPSGTASYRSVMVLTVGAVLSVLFYNNL